MVSYVLLRSGLGSPTEMGVVREATGEVTDSANVASGDTVHIDVGGKCLDAV